MVGILFDTPASYEDFRNDVFLVVEEQADRLIGDSVSAERAGTGRQLLPPAGSRDITGHPAATGGGFRSNTET